MVEDLPEEWTVALLAEGVDRNHILAAHNPQTLKSPSSRRAWIEITLPGCGSSLDPVALLAEGVDRNTVRNVEGADLGASPSSRRAWIEIAAV